MTQETCLLLRTKDKRCFLTNEKHLDTLTEFAKTFKVEVFIVELKEKTKILGLKTLATAICDQTQNYDVQHTKLEKLYPVNNKRSRKDILQEAGRIQKFILTRFTSGKKLSLKELKEKYKNCNLTDACLCQHMAKVRNNLSRKGHNFEKLGAGVYRLIS